MFCDSISSHVNHEVEKERNNYSIKQNYGIHTHLYCTFDFFFFENQQDIF